MPQRELDKIRKNHFFSPQHASEEYSAEFRSLLLSVFQTAEDFLRGQFNTHLHSTLSPTAIAQSFSDADIPLEGKDLTLILEDVREQIIKHSVQLASPYFIGHMTGVTFHFSLLIDLLISALNQNVVKVETALSATFVEKQTIAWLHKLVYQKETEFYNSLLKKPVSLGCVCAGGTIANLTALLVARNHALPEAHKSGLFHALQNGNYSKAVILTSHRGHYSLKKTAAIIGIGEENLLLIPCHPFTNKVNTVALQRMILKLKTENVCILAIVGVAGSTETGSIDPLPQLKKIALKYKIWFHVDAAWGGALLLSKNHSNMLKGIGDADSVTLDGHKFLYLTISHSVVLFKSQSALEKIKHTSRYIIRAKSYDLGKTSIEGSRKFDSLKFWFALNVLGKNGYELLIDRALSMAAEFYKMIAAHPAFEITSQLEAGIVTYRYVSRDLKNILNTQRENYLQSKQSSSLFTDINKTLNKLNIKLQETQKEKGKSFVSRTRIESFWPGNSIVVLRAIPFHPHTDIKILEEILAEQELIGNKLCAGWDCLSLRGTAFKI